MERGQKRQQGIPVTRRYEFRIVTKDKTVKWVDLSGETIMLNGNPKLGIISVLEITERKKWKRRSGRQKKTSAVLLKILLSEPALFLKQEK